jgi:hypothetical protein
VGFLSDAAADRGDGPSLTPPSTDTGADLRPLACRALKRIALIALGIVLFVLVSGVLARFLSVENTERDDDLALVQAEARGDVSGMLRSLSGCARRPSCAAEVSSLVRDPRVRKAGSVKILALDSPTAYSLTGASGTTRLAWATEGTSPVVQCIEVRRSGSFLSGIDVDLVSLSPPIGNEADC